MSKKEILTKKIEILKKLLDNQDNIIETLEAEQQNNPELADKTIEEAREEKEEKTLKR